VKSRKPRGQQAIDTTRAQEIQQALVREHYLTGEPSGTWDAATQEAMRRYQADQGWQSKTVPDSRALIRLGLGPSRDHLLNPESAMLSGTPVQSARASSVNAAGRTSLLSGQGSSSTSVSVGSDLPSAR
jgi:peptidoglycan hydrolase-like protein with peptidoglycan-binding domain